MNIRVTVSLLVVLVGVAITQAVPASEKSVEKKSPVEEKPSTTEAKKAEITEEAGAIAVEGAQEPKQADRAKKSASTTFCVEIRPGPSETPVKVCENPQPAPPPPPPPPPAPQVPQEAHEVHEQPTYIQEPESPIFIIPPPPSQVYIEPCAPQLAPQVSYLHIPQIFHPPPPPPPPQQIIIPSTIANPCPQGSAAVPLPPPPQQHVIIASGNPPCPPSPCGGLATFAGSVINRPNAVLSLYRSAIAPTEGAWSSMDGMEMRGSSDNNEMTGMDSGAAMASLRMEANEDFGAENVATSPLARTYLNKLHGNPSSMVINQRSPYVVRCNPQLLSLGSSSSSNNNRVYTYPFGNRGRSSADGMDASSSMDISPQHARHVYSSPYYSSGIGYPSHSGAIVPSVVQHSTYQSYQGPVDSSYHHHHPSEHHSFPPPGYSIHAHPPGLVMPSVTIQSHPGVPTHIFRRDEQRQQLQKQPIQEKSMRDSKQDQQKSGGSGPMSPSQMLNQMRGSGGLFNKRPMMQTFPRVNEERSSGDAGVNVNMNFPRGGQPFMIAGPTRSGMDEKNMDMDGDDGAAAAATHDELAKRQVEKLSSEKEA